MRHIAFAVPGDLATPTGGYAYDRRMIDELRRLGWQVDVVDLGEGFPWPSDETRAKAWSRLSDIPPGLTIVIDGLAFGVLPEAVLQLRVENPLVALVHHPLALESGLSMQQANILRTCERAALSAARLVIANSAETARHLTSDYGVSADNIVIARPGTDPAPMARGGSDGIVRLLAVGSIVPRKGFDVLTAALATLLDLPWRLAIAGDRSRDPQAASQLDAAIDRLKLGDRVAVLGAVSDSYLAELFADADVFVLASRFEGYGMAYCEALAHGLPVIGTTAGAISDTVPKDAGLLVPPDNAEALAAALRLVIADADKRQRMAIAARAAAQKLPTWQASAILFSDALEAMT